MSRRFLNQKERDKARRIEKKKKVSFVFEKRRNVVVCDVGLLLVVLCVIVGVRQKVLRCDASRSIA